MTDRTPLDELIDAAAPLRQRLDFLEAHSRLSARAFLAEALTNARCAEIRLDELEQVFKDNNEIDSLRAFVHRFTREISESNWPSPPPPEKIGKMLRIYCNNPAEALSQCGFIRATPAQIIAFCCRRAIRQAPRKFGIAHSSVAQRAACDDLKTKLDDIQARMRTAWTVADIVLDWSTLTPGEKANGLARVEFRRRRGLTIANDQWPALLVHAAASALPPIAADDPPPAAPEPGKITRRPLRAVVTTTAPAPAPSAA